MMNHHIAWWRLVILTGRGFWSFCRCPSASKKKQTSEGDRDAQKMAIMRNNEMRIAVATQPDEMAFPDALPPNSFHLFWIWFPWFGWDGYMFHEFDDDLVGPELLIVGR